MLGFLTPGRDAGPLIDEAAADEYWQLLPRSDPFWAQQSVSEALAELTTRAHPGRDHFRALLTLDQRAGKLSDALLRNYTNERVPSPALERKSWQAALALSQSFARAYGYALSHIAGAAPSRGLREYAPAVLLRSFQHRQIEFLLRPFISERPTSDCWADVHGACKYALAQGLLQQHAVVTRSHEERRSVSTLEREYLHVLLLELLNRGQVSPYDAFFVNRMLPRWCATLRLRVNDPQSPQATDDGAEDYLVVDPERPEGLVRSSRASAGTRLCLDPYPMLVLINDEIAALRNRVDAARATSSSGRDRKLRLLRKISAIYAPKPPPILRRGQRKPTASTVQAIVGFSHVIRMLRNERDRKSVAASAILPEGTEVVGAMALPVVGRGGNGPRPVEPDGESNGEFGVPHQVWHLKDRSDSGCRFRGQFGDANRVVPGALVAIREGVGAPWMLVVVRRRRTRIGDRVDIGVELLGRNPHGVVLASDEGNDGESQDAAKNKRNRFNALYLPESAQNPAMPFKTLVLAPCEFKVGRSLQLQSARATFTIRLKEPIEEQGDFAWLPYEVVDRREVAEHLPLQPADSKPTAMPSTRVQPRVVNSDTLTQLVTEEPDKRAAGAGTP